MISTIQVLGFTFGAMGSGVALWGIERWRVRRHRRRNKRRYGVMGKPDPACQRFPEDMP